MKKIGTITKKQFEEIISNEYNLKRFVKYPQDKKINDGWSGFSLKKLNELETNSVYLLKSAAVQGKVVFPPTVLFVSTNSEGYKIGYQSDVGKDFLDLYVPEI